MVQSLETDDFTNDIQTANEADGSSDGHDTIKGTTDKEDDMHESKQKISTADNDNEGCDAELIVEKNVDENAKEKADEEQILTNKLDNDSETSTAAKEDEADQTLEFAEQREKQEGNVHQYTEMASGKTIVSEESSCSQDIKDLPGKHEDNFVKDEEGLILSEAVVGTDTVDLISKPDGANTKVRILIKPFLIICCPCLFFEERRGGY